MPIELPVPKAPQKMSFPSVATTHVHVFGRAGVKMYVWKGIFLLLEAQGGSRVAPVSAGLGIDLF